jgi:uncharacterized FlgJ-related protein
MKKSLLGLLLLVAKLSNAASINQKDSVTVYDVYHYIKCSGILYPEIVIRQAIWETGWFKSKHVLQKNNIFGFRYSKNYMHFENWKACVDYYKKWQLRKYTNLKCRLLKC